MVRESTLGSMLFVPGDPGNIKTFEDLVRFVRDENQKIAAALAALAAGHVDMEYKEPAKRSTGDIRLADGVQWNPGSGRGLYWYDEIGTAWNFLG